MNLSPRVVQKPIKVGPEKQQKNKKNSRQKIPQNRGLAGGWDWLRSKLGALPGGQGSARETIINITAPQGGRPGVCEAIFMYKAPQSATQDIYQNTVLYYIRILYYTISVWYSIVQYSDIV